MNINNENIIYIGCAVVLKIKKIETQVKLSCKHQICWKKGKNQIKTGEKLKNNNIINFNEDL
jgi:hypothetical protein